MTEPCLNKIVTQQMYNNLIVAFMRGKSHYRIRVVLGGEQMFFVVRIIEHIDNRDTDEQILDKFLTNLRHLYTKLAQLSLNLTDISYWHTNASNPSQRKIPEKKMLVPIAQSTRIRQDLSYAYNGGINW